MRRVTRRTPGFSISIPQQLQIHPTVARENHSGRLPPIARDATTVGMERAVALSVCHLY
jgi:hypothetical protein